MENKIRPTLTRGSPFICNGFVQPHSRGIPMSGSIRAGEQPGEPDRAALSRPPLIRPARMDRLEVPIWRLQDWHTHSESSRAPKLIRGSAMRRVELNDLLCPPQRQRSHESSASASPAAGPRARPETGRLRRRMLPGSGGSIGIQGRQLTTIQIETLLGRLSASGIALAERISLSSVHIEMTRHSQRESTK